MADIRDLGRAALAAAGLLLLATAPAWAGSTERVSISSSGKQGNDVSLNPAISADGRFVAFASDASDLVPGDTNGIDCSACGKDVFIRDRRTGTTERVSISSKGVQGNGSSGDFGVALSRSGRFVAFTSDATTLVPGDTNGTADVFVHTR